MPVFDSESNSAVQVYWSPTVKYFQGRHLWYGIIAILCELIIGIGIPLVLIFQRYLIRYCNINFTSLKPVIDQLKGCYKEKYRWFVAYYLICRQVLYGVNYLADYWSSFWADNLILATPYPRFTIMLITCILIMVVHNMLQPYKSKGLNFLDSFILLTLVGLLVSALEIYWNKIIHVVFWFLPLLILINYLASFTKLKYLIIPCCCVAIFCVTFIFARYSGVFAVLLLAGSLITFILYIMYSLNRLSTRYCTTGPRYVAINEQLNNDIDENNDNNIAN